MYRENKPHILAAMFFLTSHDGLNSPTKETFLPNYTEIGPVVADKKILKTFLKRYTGKISPAPWPPCFLTNHDGLNNLGRESSKEHFCQIIL